MDDDLGKYQVFKGISGASSRPRQLNRNSSRMDEEMGNFEGNTGTLNELRPRPESPSSSRLAERLDDVLGRYEIHTGASIESPRQRNRISSRINETSFTIDNLEPIQNTRSSRNKSYNKTTPRTIERRRRWMFPAGSKIVHFEVEEHANQIVGCMENDKSLMEDNPESEALRKDALRDMPQNLTIKRCVKKKLRKSISLKGSSKPIGCWKRQKYQLSIFWSNLKLEFRNVTSAFELWYGTIKNIEGHFGSSTASYFQFLKWLFLINSFVAIVSFIFIVLPQKFAQSKSTASFSALDILTGEGYFTDTLLYYGHYTNKSAYVSRNFSYYIPFGYFFTMIILYALMFIIFSIRMARSYRQNFIETKGGLKNVLSHKIFCGWDYQIATKKTAELKSASIYQDLKATLNVIIKKKKVETCMEKFQTKVMQLIAHIIVIILMCGMGYLMWKLMESKEDLEKSNFFVLVFPSVVINLIIIIFPIIYSFLIKYEDYKSPGKSLFIIIMRIFITQMIVIGELISYWLGFADSEECLQTKLAQEVYRLIIFDFLFAVILESLFYLGKYLLNKNIPKYIDEPEFNIARNVLHIIYNQGLFWLGFYFSPLLPIVIVIKLWLTWYIRSFTVLYLCKPTSNTWRASNANVLFSILSFVCLVLIMSLLGYILIEVSTIYNCGPFTTNAFKQVINELLELKEGAGFWKVVFFITRPGVIAIVLIALLVMVYYQYEKSKAQKSIVNILREMLIWQAKDKEFLLQHISKITHGTWQYNNRNRSQYWDPVTMTPIPQSMSSDDENSDELSHSDELHLNPKKYY